MNVLAHGHIASRPLQLSSTVRGVVATVLAVLLPITESRGQSELFGLVADWRSGETRPTTGIAVGDVDRDGDLDLVCANVDEFGNRMYRNDKGALTTVFVWASDKLRSTAVALGDIDRDGDLDLVCANAGSSNTLHRNDGGSFTRTPVWSSSPTHTSESLALGDVDGDGDLDLVCGNADAPNTLYRNDGGLFPTDPIWSTAAANETRSVTMGDLDEDGDLDLVCGNLGQPSAVYRNDGGTLTDSPTWESPSRQTYAIALGDVDGDGNLDAVFANKNGKNSVHLNVGGALSTTPVWESGSSHASVGAALGDVDGDGDLDVAFANTEFPTKTLYINHQGSFEIDPAWSSEDTLDTRAVAFADIDGDAALDLLHGVYGTSGSANTLYRNVLFGMNSTPAWTSSSLREVRSAAFGDVDADGDLDLVVGSYGGANALYLSDHGVLSEVPSWESALPSATRSVALGDINGDDLLDLVCANDGNPNAVYLNENGSFEPRPSWETDAANNSAAVALADVDGNGDLDIVFGNGIVTGQANTLYLNQDGTLPTMPSWTSPGFFPTHGVTMGDVNSDGLPDLVCGNVNTNNNLYLATGGSLALVSSMESPENATRSVALGDVDGDGKLDLVCGNHTDRNALYVNQGSSPYFLRGPSWSSELDSATLSIALGDVDGDGRIDLACGDEMAQAAATLYLNEIDGTFPKSPVWTAAHDGGSKGIALGDVDADGDLDLFAGRSAAFGSVIYAGLRDPVYKGDPLNPSNHLPNNDAHLRSVKLDRFAENTIRVRFRGVDLESDPLWVIPEFQWAGVPVWSSMKVVETEVPVGPLATSPAGVDHELQLDVTGLPTDRRTAVVRLRAFSHPTSTGLVRHVASYHVAVREILPLRAEIEIFPTVLEFPTVTLGDSIDVALTISNPGTKALTVSDVESPSEEIQLSPAPPFQIDPAEMQVLTLTLAPRTRTVLDDELRILSDAFGNAEVNLPVVADIRSLSVVTSILVDTEPIPLHQSFAVLVTPHDGVVIERGALWYRPSTAGASSTIEMTRRANDTFIGVIPTNAVTEQDLELYVEVENSGVFATDPPGAPGGAWYFLDVATPDSLTTEISSVTVGQPALLQAFLPGGSVFSSGRLHFRAGGEAAYREFLLTDEGVVPSVTIPGNEIGAAGLEYWVEVNTLTTRLTVPRNDPAGNPLRVRSSVTNLTEGSGPYPARRYRMITIPLDFAPTEWTLEQLLVEQTATFGPYDTNRWRAFRYFPEGVNQNVEITETSVASELHVIPGRAYWLVSRETGLVDTHPANGLSTPTGAAFPIVLAPGWNQIGNPFTFPVAWGDVQTPGSVDPPVEFSPEASDYLSDAPARLEPFRGYFVRNHSGPDTLWIPPVRASEARMPTSMPETAESWRMDVLASTEVGARASVTLGTLEQASNQYDQFDRAQPPMPPTPWVSLAIDNRDWAERPGDYRRDMRAAAAQGHTWRMEIRTEAAGAVVALTGEQHGGPQPAVRVIDIEQGSVMNPGQTSVHEIIAFGPKRPYRVAIVAGTAGYVEAETSFIADAPIALSLSRSAPTPFRSSTRIRFGIPEASFVRVRVYDLSGRRLTTLVDQDRVSPGFHTVLWNGTDAIGRRVASGVYFCRLETALGTKSRKLLLLR